MKFNFKKLKLAKLIRLLNPSPQIGGLEITDHALRFFVYEKEKMSFEQASLTLPSGIIENGKIIDEKNFIAALRNLHGQITRKKKKNIPVIVSIASNNIYTQVFNLPFLEQEQLEEAALLNLQMISPIKKETAYSDWQILGESAIGTQEVLGAFIETSFADKLISSLEDTFFLVVAIEFMPLSLTRFLDDSGVIDLKVPYLVIDISAEGIDFLVVYNANLFFSHNIPWSAIGKDLERVTFESFKKAVAKELRKILNYYHTRWGNGISNVILINYNATKEIVEWLEKEELLKVTVLNQYQNLNSVWFPAIGGALRGLIPRSEDRMISLASVGTEENYFRNRILSFVNYWRNISFSVLAALIFVYLIADLAFIRTNKALKSEISVARVPVNEPELMILEAEAKKFNSLADKALAAKNQSSKWASLFIKIVNLATINRLNLTQIVFNPSNLTVSLVGTGQNQRLILTFKNNLIGDPVFIDVYLPNAAISPTPRGDFLFNATFKIKK